MSSATSASNSTHVSVKRPNVVVIGTVVWLASELMFFAGLFAMYFTHRSVAGPENWAEGTNVLNVPWALTITIILVSSSVTCQFGVWAAERRQRRRSGALWQVRQWGMNEWYILTYILGSLFIAGQIFEYAELVEHNMTIANSTYGSVFFITTGFHGLHVIGGLIAFLFVIGRSFATKRFTQQEETAAITISYYWHFVDAIWIALFFIIYFLQ
ncbi:MAG TPA: heme-copper oxidase subunit III [Beutenbergiaceae bacterium]|nr:heme-copper oxidase subunit III [Beutenbergiaceae bacterium]